MRGHRPRHDTAESMQDGRARQYTYGLAEQDRPAGGYRQLVRPDGDDSPRSTASPPPASAGSISIALVRVTRLHVMRARHLLLRLGLHPGHELLLMHLWEVGSQRQSELMVAFDTDSASMTRTVQRLERAGYVRRSPHPTDGRATLVESTPAGDALRVQI